LAKAARQTKGMIEAGHTAMTKSIANQKAAQSKTQAQIVNKSSL
jgi:hypothetical protein